MAIRDILLLGNPLLYEACETVVRHELEELSPVIEDLHDTMLDFRLRHGTGRAIAAPQIGVMKRLVVMDIDRRIVFLNPALDMMSGETFDLWDDCMSFPGLLVKVRRHLRCRLRYKDEQWIDRELTLEGALSELLQHECDHCDGILAVQRALDGKALALVSERRSAG
jgi:peptide deformylase